MMPESPGSSQSAGNDFIPDNWITVTLSPAATDSHTHMMPKSPGSSQSAGNGFIPDNWIIATPSPPAATSCRFASSVWREDTIGHYLCQECGLYHQFNREMSRVQVIKAKARGASSASRRANNNICSNCGTSITSLWRRDSHGASICNACGLYYKLHQSNRPITLKKDIIQTRKRKPKTQCTQSSKEASTIASIDLAESENISQM